MAAPVSLKNKNYHQGMFKPKNPKKYIGDVNKINYKSGLELKAMLRFDSDPNVLRWNSEDLIIPYFSRADNKQRKYYIDFVIEIRTKNDITKTFLVEVKPYKQTLPSTAKSKKNYLKESYDYTVNTDKWNSARKYATRIGAEFIIITEKDFK